MIYRDRHDYLELRAWCRIHDAAATVQLSAGYRGAGWVASARLPKRGVEARVRGTTVDDAFAALGAALRELV